MPRRSQSPSRRGTIIVLAAFCLVIVMAFVAFSVDWGYIVVTESELQNAADSGALSGARTLQDGRKAAIDAAQFWAAKNIAAGQSVDVTDDDVEIGVWDEDTASFTVLAANSKTSPNAVRVTCRRTAARKNALQLLFAPVIGTDTADIKVSAIALSQASRCGLIIGIPSVVMSGSSHTDSYNAEEGRYSKSSAGPEGHVCTNGNITMSGSTAINGDAHPGVTGIVKSSSSIGVKGETECLKQPMAYPPVDASGVKASNNNAKIPLSMNKKQPLNSKKEFVLSGGDNVSLPPGKYYFTKMTLSGSSTVGISGATEIYVSGDVDLSGGSVTNLTYMPKNFMLFPMGSKCVVSGSSELYGVVYGPTTKVERSGSSDYFGAIIGGELVLSGSGGIHADLSLDIQILGGAARRATLVQ
ncbi:MAG TPA: pilus assembly protein TadG-related protein [Planctomycetaceae bacterium]|nr:pilus assembly protein TadG-related protein [Planctomycetaceae bacterium]